MQNQQKDSYRFVVEAVLLGLQLCVGIIWVAPGPIFSAIMQEFSVDRTVVSLTTSLVPLLMAAFAIPAGILASRIGLKKVFSVGALLMAAGILTLFSTNIYQLLASRIIIAIGVALSFPLISALVMQWFKPREIPLVNGLNMSASTVGNAIALFGTVAIANAFGWRWSLASYSILALAFAIAWVLFGRERKLMIVNPQKDSAVPRLSIAGALRQKTTFLIGLSMIGPFIIYMAISSWLPTYYHEVFGMSLVKASSIAGLFTIFGIPACILGGFLPMRTGLRKPFLIIPGLLLGIAALGTFITNNLVVIYISVALFGICDLIYMPSLITLAMELPGLSPHTAAVVIAMGMAIGNLSGFAGPLLVGWLTDMTGSYLPGFIICSLLSFSLFIGALLLPETGPAAKNKRLPAGDW
jgi:cyanate permease